MAEPSAVNRVVVGSSPTCGANASIAITAEQRTCNAKVVSSTLTAGSHLPLAQFGSASALGAEGRRFESCMVDHGIYRERRIGSGNYLSLPVIYVDTVFSASSLYPHLERCQSG